MIINLQEFRKLHSIDNQSDFWDLLTDWSESNKVPALCSHMCEVTPDAKCDHGAPSIIVRVIGVN